MVSRLIIRKINNKYRVDRFSIEDGYSSIHEVGSFNRLEGAQGEHPEAVQVRKMVCSTMPEEEFRDGHDDGMGICLVCHETQGGCEPDARGYCCDICNNDSVYGFDEALMMGKIQFS